MIDSVARGLAQAPLPGRAAEYRARVPVFEVLTEYNPERRTAVQIVPALIGVILNMTMVIFTAAAIVRERERGNLELLITTPIRSWELMAGKLFPYVLIGLVQTTLILTVGARVFDVPINGSLVDLYLAAALFIAATLTLGLVISTLVKTQMQAFQLSFMTLLPSILLSGFVFPFDGMPKLAQWIAQVLPLTHFVEMIRGILLRGAPLAAMQWPAAKLGVLLRRHARRLRRCGSGRRSTDRRSAALRSTQRSGAGPFEFRDLFRRAGKADTLAGKDPGIRTPDAPRLSASDRRGHGHRLRRRKSSADRKRTAHVAPQRGIGLPRKPLVGVAAADSSRRGGAAKNGRRASGLAAVDVDAPCETLGLAERFAQAPSDQAAVRYILRAHVSSRAGGCTESRPASPPTP